ncbi:hypothetical protein C7974DRAFT_413228 [Boeremia exigua]|uniref:uncharacterized protein n=1 Tax=Boeremia exigua TaxID=749465 RepID=UPI001E8E08A5|nr:uncharacterized protein C7974DRAFT_413228 [Boeremia exigua]KAH6629429.1 hypothetical protein C7974DRAFT_413228 [Boeremia exigua]
MTQASFSDFDSPAVPNEASSHATSMCNTPSAHETAVTPKSVTHQASPFAIVPSMPTISVTVTLTVIHTPDTNFSEASYLHLIRPSELDFSMITTRTHPTVPEVTVASFELYVSPVDPSTVAVPTGSTIDNGSITSSPALAPAAIVGIAIGTITITAAFIVLSLYLYRRNHSAKYRSDTEAMTSEAVLEAKLQRAQDLRIHRLSTHGKALSTQPLKMAAKKLACIVEKERMVRVTNDEGIDNAGNVQAHFDRVRRPSGLAMHPPTPTMAT